MRTHQPEFGTWW